MKKTKILVSLLCFTIIFSCRKEKVPTIPSDVYIAGTILKNFSNQHFRAVYWKNNQMIYLSAEDKDAYATDIFVLNNDIYISGYEKNGNSTNAVFWKNGIQTNLTNFVNDSTKYSIAKSIKAIANTVYIGGEEMQRGEPYAKYWTNEIGTFITNNSSHFRDMDIAGNDIYTVGYLTSKFINPLDNKNFWKNTTGSFVGLDSVPASLNTVKVENGNVYVAGSNDNYPAFWKNGIPRILSGFGTGNGYVKDIFIYSTDEYFAGTNNGKATYWKNGTEHTYLTTGNYLAVATGIFVIKTDIHAVGFEMNVSNIPQAKYFLNGQTKTLNDSIAEYSIANAIYVVEK